MEKKRKKKNKEEEKEDEEKKKILDIKHVFRLSLQLLSETYFILRRNE
jgi:hypothetical protein